MSARLLSSRVAARRPPPIASLRRFHTAVRPSAGGGILRSESVLQTRGQRWQGQVYRYHNSGAVAVRQMSFARSLPKLVLKFARVPAAFGGIAIAGLAYVQYKAERESSSSDSRGNRS